jgi:hypothetical protein
MAMIAFSAGGLRIAMWMELKPPQEMPNMPTLPFENGRAASQAITASPSCCSCSVYSYSMSLPALSPVPRMSTRATTYPRCTKYEYTW